MFKGKLPNGNGVSISIIDSDELSHPIRPADMLVSGLQGIALGSPIPLLNSIMDEYLEDNIPKVLPHSTVEHPKHYRKETGLEAIEVIEAWDLNFNLGNVVKYVCRAGLKDKSERKEDLEKAIWYLSRELESSSKE